MPAKSEIIEEIRARTDLVKLVGEYVPLRRSGRRYVGLCPFHHESSPSFGVNPEGQFYYCFGCKAGGDAFDFIMRLEGLDFPEAASLLAERTGIQWAPQTPEETAREKHRAQLFRLNAMAAEVYRRALAAPRLGHEARLYLQNRGLDPGTASRFKLGYAPPLFHALVDVLRRYGYRLEEAAEIGLVLSSANGYIDRFRDRLVFPLVDPRGRVVGFGARVLRDGQPKYLNSSDSILFNKSRFLYGLNLAHEAMRRSGAAVLVEGYLDAITAHLAGVENVVANLGTALTEYHAEMIKRFVGQVILAYDGDNAGQAATVRGLDVLQRAGLTVRVAILPPGQDPDELIRREGVESFRGLLTVALPLTEFLLHRAVLGLDLSGPEDRAAAVQACLPILAEVASASAREGYIRQVAGRVHVHEDTIAADLADYLRHQRKERHVMDNTSKDSNTNRCGANAEDSKANPAEKEVLRTVLKEYSLMARIREELKAEDFAPGPLRDIYRLMLAHGGSLDLVELLKEIAGETRQTLLELSAAEDEELAPPVKLDAWPKCVQRIKAAALRRRLFEVEAQRLALQQGDDFEERLTVCLHEELLLKKQLDECQRHSGFGGA